MKRIAVFGNAGGGKSTLARRLADITGLPLIVLDNLGYPDGYRRDREAGGKLSDAEFRKAHDEIVERPEWVIDGYGSPETLWPRLALADTLVHVDLPVALHYWGVTKRLARGLIKTPPGWPDNSPVWESSLSSYRVIRLCHRHLTPRYREFVAKAPPGRAHHLRSYGEMRIFLERVEQTYRTEKQA